MPVLAAMTVIMFAIGLTLIAVGWRGTPEREREGEERELDRHTLIRAAAGFGSAMVALMLTRWVGLAIALGAVVFTLWGMFSDRAGRERDRRRLGALTSWLEMLRDSVSTGSGIVKAITVTSTRAPAPVRPEVRLLAVNLESMQLDQALSRFGSDLDMPGADTAIAALVIASRQHGGNLARLLTGVIESTRRRLDQQNRVEAMRSQFTTASVLMVVVTSAAAILIIGGSPQFRRTYDSVVGQMVIVGVGSIFVLAILVLRRMAKARAKVRLIGSDRL